MRVKVKLTPIFMSYVTRDADNTFLAVSNVSQTALASNPNRKSATFVNDSANTIYLGLEDAAVVGSGIRLNANGGSYEINYINRFTGLVTAIAGVVGPSNLTVTETPA